MKQGRWLSVCVAIAVVAGSLVVIPSAGAAARAKSTATASSEGKAKAGRSAKALRQFTGYVTSIDENELTVEKRGKAARTMTFVRNEGMKSVGDVAKDSRVTVFYREDGGKAVAHRVVVKESSSG
jgi:hypothetical protein